VGASWQYQPCQLGVKLKKLFATVDIKAAEFKLKRLLDLEARTLDANFSKPIFMRFAGLNIGSAFD